MSKKNLSDKIILKSAIELIEARGYESFSLRELASYLDCKPASLYNHISGLDEIKAMLSIFFSKQIQTSMENAVLGKDDDDAFIAAANAYRVFALNNYELYKLFISSPSLHRDEVKIAGIESFSPIKKIVMKYNLSESDTIHFIRAIRSYMHGFIELSANGFMQTPEYSKDKSYDIMLRQLLLMMRLRGKGIEL